jgi:integration host factor subunit beta
VTKKEIVEIVVQQMNRKGERIAITHIKLIVECVFESFIDLLAIDGRIEIRGFGTFRVKKTPARVGRNPVTGEEAVVPSRNIIQFKAGNHMKDCSNRD